MEEDNLKSLIRQAHAFYGETSIFEVIDVDRNAGVAQSWAEIPSLTCLLTVNV
ncbi:MAG: hypothetical protein Q8R88_05890 [Desulfoprunum sp.]|nr:hypothetical protein [Desulfoprunum sp.]